MSERVVSAAAPWVAGAFLLMVFWLIGAVAFGWGFNGVSLATVLVLVVAALRALLVASGREGAPRA